MTEEEYLNRRAMAQGNVPEPQPVTVNPSTGGIQPIKQSGLYAIYNQRNPYSAQAERLSAMSGRDMGGRLGQLPGIVATLMAGKANRKSEEFEAERQSKLEAIMASNAAWEKIQNDKEAQLRDIKLAKELVEPKAMQAYIQKFKETGGDTKVSGDFAAQVYNAGAKENNLTSLPEMRVFTGWADGEWTGIWDSKLGIPVQGKRDKYGNLGKLNEKNEWIPTDANDLLLSAYNEKQKAEASKARAEQGPNVHGLMKYFDANDNLVAYAKISPDQAVTLGATKYGEWYKTGATDAGGKDIWDMRKVPLKSAPKKPAGKLIKPDAPAAMPTPPAKAEQVSTQYERPNPVPGSPGSGQSVQTPTAPSSELRMKDPKSGRFAIYDGATKKFMRWE